MLTRRHVECDAVENYCTITCDCHYILFYGRNIHDDHESLCNTMQFFIPHTCPFILGCRKKSAA